MSSQNKNLRLKQNPIKFKRILGLLKVKPMSVRQVTMALGMPMVKRNLVQSALSALKAEGKLVRMRGGLYGMPKADKILIGRLSQKQPGFAFLIPDQEGEEDIYLPASNMKNAMSGDQVEVRVYTDDRFGGRRRAQVISIIKRARENIVGVFKKQRGYGLLKPDGLSFVREFFISKDDCQKADDQEKVVAKVIKWPDQFEAGQAKIIEVLGKSTDPGVDITAIIRRFNLPEGFSLAAREQAEKIAIEPDQSYYENRVDCRQKSIVTIDGADARDFDDAVYCEPRHQGGWYLEVHIADVGHYLKTGTPLDLEARERGTSVYLPDRVLHMLPEELSCGVCSLVPDKDRFAVSAIMTINEKGEIIESSFQRSVIRSAARLTYDWVEEIIQGEQTDNPARDFKPMLLHLLAVSKALRSNRDKRGNLDFDLPDAKVVLDEKGQVATIEKRLQLTSHQIIEDCMIAANEAVASYLSGVAMPALFRIHEPPSGEKMDEFKLFLEAYGYSFKAGKAREASLAFQSLLLSWKGKPEEVILNHALLRAMKLAVYSPVNRGHFGLGSSCYTHFTSPIRRYPDLIIHRMLITHLEQGRPLGRRFQELKERMPEWADHLSRQERLAEKAERLAVRAKQMLFMKSKLGEVYEGVITSVKSFGFFVELKEYFVEGLVLMSKLQDDYYQYEKDQGYLYGVNNGREFRTGFPVIIRVTEVDEDEIRVYFQLNDSNRKPNKQQSKNPPRIVKAKRRKKR